LAAHLAPRDPDTLFLEVLNEPVLADVQAWAAIQRTLLAALREGAPYHTLIATGHRWSEIPELLELEPVEDPNVVYNFHCYEPHIFTHQGATWGVPYWEQLRRVPYPVNTDAIEALLPTLTDEEAKAGLTRYHEGGWNEGKMTAWIRQAAAWGQQHQVPLTCNEFGVYRAKSLPAHRLAWLTDVRTALESYGIGWTMWDYAGGFSVVNTIEGRRVADAGTVEALGLNREVYAV
jgi:endoglucanase